MKNMKRTILVSLIFLSVISLKSQPNWTVNPSQYSYNMTVTAVVNLNYQEELDTNLLAAFVGNECRGVCQAVYKNEINRYVFYLMIYSNTINEIVSFKVYDVSSDQIVDIPKTVNFEINAIVGSLEAPYIISSPTLSSESKILTYALKEQVQDAIIDSVNNKIYCTIPWGDSFDSLTAIYTTSHLAKVFVNNTLQTSGVTVNDFSNPLVYKIISADETDTSYYNVFVNWQNFIPDNIYLSDTIIDASYHKGSFIGYFTTEDKDTADIHSYSLVNGDGDDDNNSFIIEGNELYLNSDVYFESIDYFSIRVQSDDNRGGQIEKVFRIYIDYISENSVIRANHIISPNNDGIFDTWTIQNSVLFRNAKIYIFDKDGKIVFNSIGYDVPWDGTCNGEKLPADAYFYLIEFSDNIKFKGVISLIY
ncbi:MAG: hypothetical protein Kow0068_03950 [Marinilabiliales bacterium]